MKQKFGFLFLHLFLDFVYGGGQPVLRDLPLLQQLLQRQLYILLSSPRQLNINRSSAPEAVFDSSLGDEGIVPAI